MRPSIVPIERLHEVPRSFGTMVHALRCAIPRNHDREQPISRADLFYAIGMGHPENDTTPTPKAYAVFRRIEDDMQGSTLSIENIKALALYFRAEGVLNNKAVPLLTNDNISFAGQFFRLAIQKLSTQSARHSLPPADYAGREELLAFACKEHFITPSERDHLGEMLGVYASASQDHRHKPGHLIWNAQRSHPDMKLPGHKDVIAEPDGKGNLRW